MGNFNLSLEDLYFNLQNAILEHVGLKIYQRKEGFTAGELYNIAGRADVVVNLTFIKDSKYAKLYNDFGIVGVFTYTMNERKRLEADNTSLDNYNTIKFQDILQHDMPTLEINPHEIATVITTPQLFPENAFTSQEKRSIHTIKIPFESKGHSRDVILKYQALQKLINYGIALTPEEHSCFLACKLMLDTEHFTEDEKREIYNSDGKVYNKEVAYQYLTLGKKAGILGEKYICILKELENNRFAERLQILDSELSNIGLSIAEFRKTYPNKFILLMKRTLLFHEIRYNISGNHLLYMNFKSFVHIYLRHVEELKFDNKYAEKDKFQLHEEDVFDVMRIVLQAINNEYQEWRTDHTKGRFCRTKDDAYYYNGDYYNIIVEEDGHIVTFYRGTRAYESKSKRPTK